jgi:hypothetical protein
MQLVKLFVCLVAAIAIAAAASSYPITVPGALQVGNAHIQAGAYTLVVEGNQAIFKQGEFSIPVPVSMEKNRSTARETVIETVGTALHAINLGGTNLKLVFGSQAAKLNESETEAVESAATKRPDPPAPAVDAPAPAVQANDTRPAKAVNESSESRSAAGPTGSYTISVPATLQVGDAHLKPGTYKVSVEGNQAMFRQGKSSISVPVNVEKNRNTAQDTAMETAGSSLHAINLGGTNVKLVFANEPVAATESESTAAGSAIVNRSTETRTETPARELQAEKAASGSSDSLGLASVAGVYSITVASMLEVGDAQLKAGAYKLTVEGNQATFRQGKSSISVPVNVEKNRNTAQDTAFETAGTMLHAINLGGTNTKLVFPGKSLKATNGNE